MKCRARAFFGSIIALSGISMWIQLNILFPKNDIVKTRVLLMSNVSTDNSVSPYRGGSDLTALISLPYSNIHTNLQPRHDFNKSENNIPIEISNSSKGTQVTRLYTEKINLPGIHIYLPHLKNKEDYLIPALKVSQNRTGVKLVIGIPTIRRPMHDYLSSTLNSLVTSLSSSQALECLIIVFIAEPWNKSSVQELVNIVKEDHSVHIASGLIDIIAPKAEFYPNLNFLSPTLDDNLDRFRWRTKQNLDYAYLMLQAHSRGKYYIQLEDDVVTKPAFYSYITYNLSWRGNDWFVLKFSPLGFIGKLFRTKDLPFIAEFLLMFYSDKPGDWLLENIVTTKVCGKNMIWKECLAHGRRIAIEVRPSLFQHIGYHSSLKGKVQSLKDRSFRNNPVLKTGPETLKVNFNPTPTNIETTIKQYMNNKIEYAYIGKGFFWGITPSKDDVIDFIYDPPINITRYKLVSGAVLTKQDMFPADTTVEVYVANSKSSNVSKSKAFRVVSKFDNHGVAEGKLEKVGSIGVFRIHVNSNMTTWVIMSEISITVV